MTPLWRLRDIQLAAGPFTWHCTLHMLVTDCHLYICTAIAKTLVLHQLVLPMIEYVRKRVCSIRRRFACGGHSGFVLRVTDSSSAAQLATCMSLLRCLPNAHREVEGLALFLHRKRHIYAAGNTAQVPAQGNLQLIFHTCCTHACRDVRDDPVTDDWTHTNSPLLNASMSQPSHTKYARFAWICVNFLSSPGRKAPGCAHQVPGARLETVHMWPRLRPVVTQSCLCSSHFK